MGEPGDPREGARASGTTAPRPARVPAERVDQALYLLLSAAAVALCALQAAHGFWIGDFFPHASAVRELAAHPLRPSHPMFDLARPYVYFSPYHLLAGLLSRTLGASAVATLAVLGVLNVVFLCHALRRLVVRLAPAGAGFAPSLALLFILVMWGKDPWPWSGFVHWHVLAWVAPYPSTVVVGLTFYALSLDVEGLAGRPWRIAARAALVGVSFLVHPVTAAIGVVASAVLFLCQADRERSWREGAILALATLGGFAVALLWPYFPLWSLLTQGQSPDFSQQSAELYVAPFMRIWPIVLWAPLLAWRLSSRWRDPLAWLALVSIGFYLLGSATGMTGFGRLVSWVVMWTHVGAAITLAGLAWRVRGVRWAPAAGALVALLFAARDTRPLAHARTEGPFLWQAVRELTGPLEREDVVLADNVTGEQLTALTGRVIASYNVQYWIPEHDQRKRDLAAFFDPGTSDEERRALIARYRARWILINERVLGLEAPELERLLALGEAKARLGILTLVALP
jgi:hypothetical protein